MGSCFRGSTLLPVVVSSLLQALICPIRWGSGKPTLPSTCDSGGVFNGTCQISHTQPQRVEGDPLWGKLYRLLVSVCVTATIV
jgi:hypothetical protein